MNTETSHEPSAISPETTALAKKLVEKWWKEGKLSYVHTPEDIVTLAFIIEFRRLPTPTDECK